MATHPRSQQVRAEINILVYTKPPEEILLTISQKTFMFVLLYIMKTKNKTKKTPKTKHGGKRLEVPSVQLKTSRDSETAILYKQILVRGVVKTKIPMGSV